MFTRRLLVKTISNMLCVNVVICIMLKFVNILFFNLMWNFSFCIHLLWSAWNEVFLVLPIRGMAVKGLLKTSAVVQKAFIEVNEGNQRLQRLLPWPSSSVAIHLSSNARNLFSSSKISWLVLSCLLAGWLNHPKIRV